MQDYQSTVQGPQNLPVVTRINKELRPALDILKPELAAVLPPHITPEAMVRYAITACQDTPKLLECDRTSLFRSVMTAAVLGLEVDAKIGLAYILPFYDRGSNKAQFIPGYKGYITLAQNAGFYVSSGVVREGDEFDYAHGTKGFLHHRPAGRLTGKERGEILGAYAIAKNPQGVEIFKVLELEDIYVSRAASASYKSHLQDPKKKSPWIDNPAAMYAKTAVRMLAPQLPTNVQRAAAVESHYEHTGRAAYIAPELKEGPQGLTFTGQMDVVLEQEDPPRGAEYTVKDQPNLSQELNLGTDAVCGTCAGSGVKKTPDTIEPCPDCSKQK